MSGHSITYIHSGRMPSNLAHTIQVMRMCEGFKRSGRAVGLLARRAYADRSVAAGELYAHYGISSGFPIELYAGPSCGRRTSFFRHIELFRFSAWALRHPWSRGATLIYTRNPHTALMCSALGRSFVFEEHAPPAKFFDRRIRSRIYRSASAQAIVFISKALLDIVREANLLRSATARTCVAHDAAALPANAPSAGALAMHGANAAKTAGYIGSLLPGRGIEIIMGIAEAMPDVRFRIVGGSVAEVARCRDRGPGNIEWVGQVEPGEVSGHYARMNVLLMPYQQDTRTRGGLCSAAWMSPLKLFEYMASGVPVVASDLPVLREVLRSGHNALLVPPRDVGAWVAAVTRVLSSEGLSSRLARQAFEDVRTTHNWENRARCILACLPRSANAAPMPETGTN